MCISDNREIEVRDRVYKGDGIKHTTLLHNVNTHIIDQSVPRWYILSGSLSHHPKPPTLNLIGEPDTPWMLLDI
jgi:hypothetical protein